VERQEAAHWKHDEIFRMREEIHVLLLHFGKSNMLLVMR